MGQVFEWSKGTNLADVVFAAERSLRESRNLFDVEDLTLIPQEQGDSLSIEIKSPKPAKRRVSTVTAHITKPYLPDGDFERQFLGALGYVGNGRFFSFAIGNPSQMDTHEFSYTLCLPAEKRWVAFLIDRHPEQIGLWGALWTNTWSGFLYSCFSDRVLSWQHPREITHDEASRYASFLDELGIKYTINGHISVNRIQLGMNTSPERQASAYQWASANYDSVSITSHGSLGDMCVTDSYHQGSRQRGWTVERWYSRPWAYGSLNPNHINGFQQFLQDNFGVQFSGREWRYSGGGKVNPKVTLVTGPSVEIIK